MGGGLWVSGGRVREKGLGLLLSLGILMSVDG